MAGWVKLFLSLSLWRNSFLYAFHINIQIYIFKKNIETIKKLYVIIFMISCPNNTIVYGVIC